MRAYTVAATAVTLRMPVKWVDNVLSHHRIFGVAQARQGVTRRLNPQAILVLEIALRLSRTLGVPIKKALEVSAELCEASGDTVSIALHGAGKLVVDMAAARRETMTRLAEAVEIAPTPRRGRPRQ